MWSQKNVKVMSKLKLKLKYKAANQKFIKKCIESFLVYIFLILKKF